MTRLFGRRFLPPAVLLAFAVTAGGSGCGSVKRLFRPPDAPPPPTWSAEIADSIRAQSEAAPIDSAAFHPPSSASGSTGAPSRGGSNGASRRTAEPGERPQAEAGPPGSETTETSPADTLLEEGGAGQSSISVALTDAEKLRLKAVTEDDLRIAELSVTRSVDRVQTEEQKQKLRTVRGLIDQARKAFDHEDLQAAANLAHKARLLADELGSALPPR